MVQENTIFSVKSADDIDRISENLARVLQQLDDLKLDLPAVKVAEAIDALNEESSKQHARNRKP